MNLDHFYEKLFDATLHGGIQYILEVTYSFIELPIMVVDAGYKVLAIVNPYPVDDQIWNFLAQHRDASNDLIWLFYEEKYMESVCNSPKPIYLDWGSLRIPQISGAIRIDGVVQGYIGIICPKDNYSDQLMDVIEKVLGAISVDMSRHKNTSFQKPSLVNLFTKELFQGKFNQSSSLEVWRHNLPYLFTQKYQLGAFIVADKSEQSLLSYFSNLIASKFPYCLTYIEEKTLFVFFYGDDSPKSRNNFLENELGSLHSHYSLSPVFYDLTYAHYYKFQTQNALNVGLKKNPKKVAYHYPDYFIPIVLSFSLQKMDTYNFLHPIIDTLQKFDAKNKTDYLKTLECFILSFGNRRLVADQMHIHRNTVLYRLNKIGEICNFDIEDSQICSQLLFSFYLITNHQDLL